jgi:hypothetical protein
MKKNEIYLRDTYFCEAIQMLKQKYPASVVILKVAYEKAKIERSLNKIGYAILQTTGEQIEVAKIINSYAIY